MKIVSINTRLIIIIIIMNFVSINTSRIVVMGLLISVTDGNFFLLSDIMDLCHQSSAMCIIILGGEDTHPWSATKVRNPIPATIPVDQ